MLRSTIRILSVTTLMASVATGAVLVTQRSAEPADAAAAPAASAALTLGGTPVPASAALTEASERHAAVALNHRLTLAREKNARAAAARRAAEKAAAEKAATRARAAAAAREVARKTAAARATRNAARDPKSAARAMLADFGWGSGQFSCLESLWEKESNWNHRAQNPSSGAYGIPQSLPGRKMASAGSDWRTNPVTQMRWGLGYIEDRFGTPCGAWAHSQANGWY